MMRPDERLEVARLAYLRAIRLARACSTPATWRRVLAASRNLGTAIRDREREPVARGTPAARADGRAPAEARGGSRVPRTAAAGVPRARGRGDGVDASARPARVTTDLWASITAEWRRACALMEESRRLVRNAQAIRDGYAPLAAAGLGAVPMPEPQG